MKSRPKNNGNVPIAKHSLLRTDPECVPVPKRRSRRRYFFDRRTVSAKRWSSLFAEYFKATGQRHPQLCAVAASLAIERERLDHALAAGQALSTRDVDHLVRLSGTLTRVLTKLGIIEGSSRIERLIDDAKREARA